MMNGDKGKKGSNFERQSETEAEASETPKQDGRIEIETLESISTVVSEVKTKGMAVLQAELQKELRLPHMLQGRY